MTIEKKYAQMKLFVLVLLLLNIFLSLYTAFFEPSVYSLETMKAGGLENMKMAKQLYRSDIYIQQQKTTLEQLLGSVNQVTDLPTISQPGIGEELPTVIE